MPVAAERKTLPETRQSGEEVVSVPGAFDHLCDFDGALVQHANLPWDVASRDRDRRTDGQQQLQRKLWPKHGRRSLDSSIDMRPIALVCGPLTLVGKARDVALTAQYENLLRRVDL